MKKLLFAAITLCCSLPSSAQEPDTAATANGFKLSGNADAYWRNSANGQPSTTHFPILRHRCADWGWANLAVEWQHDRWHALLDAAAGPRAEAFEGKGWNQAVQQASLSFAASGALTLTGGYLYFPFTSEYAQPGMNPTYTYSILYSSIPVGYSGVKADWAISENWAAWAALWGDPNSRFGSFHPHPGLGLSYTSGSFTGYLNLAEGKDFDTVRNAAAEVIGQWQLTKRLSATLDWMENFSKGEGQSATGFSSLVGYLKYDLSAHCSLAGRGEWFRDPDAAVFGAAHNSIFALTISPRFQWWHIIFQPEWRVEKAAKPIYPVSETAFGRRDAQFLLALIYKFGSYPE